MVYKSTNNGNMYSGTNGERLASFTAPLTEGVEFFETDTGNTYKVLFSAWVQIATNTGGGASTFDALTDTPANKTGQADRFPRVNAGETALEYVVLTESMITDLSHVDPNAIHDNVAGEIVLITEKATPIAADLLLIEDSADTNNKKRVQIGNLPVAAHNIVGSSHTVTGSEFDLVGLTGTNTLGILTPSSNTSAGTEAILKSDASGYLSVDHIGIGATALDNRLIRGFGTISETGADDVFAMDFSEVDLSPSNSFGGTYLRLGGRVVTAATHSFIRGIDVTFSSISGGGTVAGFTGLYVSDVTLGSTSNWAIYTNSGLNSLGDDLQFRQAATISTTTGQLTIDGAGGVVINDDGDDEDFRVEGVGQANALFVQGSDGFVGVNNGTPSYQLDVTGVAQIANYMGVGGAPNALVDIKTTRTATNESSLNASIWTTITANPANAPAVGTTYRGMLLQANTAGSVSLANAIAYGFLGQVTHGNTNTLGTAVGVNVGTFLTTSGTITTSIGVQISGVSNSGGGTVVNQYGLFVGAISGATNNYAIYTNAGDVRLMASASDKIGLHGATPVAKQTITGSRGGNVALANLLTALALRGDIVNNTTA